MKQFLSAILFVHLSHFALSAPPCAKLYSDTNLTGSFFSLDDNDQSMSLIDDLRPTQMGLDFTKSLKVEQSCALKICSEPYLDGTCQNLRSGTYLTTSSLNVSISSVSCSCQRDCRCHDVFIRKEVCGRAYFGGGCNQCNAPYIELEGKQDLVVFPEGYGKVKAFKLRKGCTLTLYSEDDFNGDEETIRNELVQAGEFQSFECSCNDAEYEEEVQPPRPFQNPPYLNIPEKIDDVLKYLTNGSLTTLTHPGLGAAYNSIKNGRSGNNAYILLLGSSGAGKSSAINALLGKNVTLAGRDASTTSDIIELRIPVPVDELGIANSELRLIDTPGLGDTNGLDRDAAFLASLDLYLSTHPELKDRLPNIVLIFHKFNDNRFSGEGSSFVKMLRGIDSFRNRITDENFSNVIFVFSHLTSASKLLQTRPDIKLNRFKKVIEDYTLFPKPIITTVAEHKAKDAGLPMINGNYLLPNNELFPRNLIEKMELVTKKVDDSIGHSVISSAFKNPSPALNISSNVFKVIRNNPKFSYYFHLIANAIFSIDKTEVSQRLQQVWDGLNSVQKSRIGNSSLAKLQRALSIRNINRLLDIPKTSQEILELLISVKATDGENELLKHLVTPPNFPQRVLVGSGYNVLGNEVLSKSPFKMGQLESSCVGFNLPKLIDCSLDEDTSGKMIVVESRLDYLALRMVLMGISGGTFANESLTNNVLPGFNVWDNKCEVGGCRLTAVKEYNQFNLNLSENFELNDEFKRRARNLKAFDDEDYENVESWRDFFGDYGTHVVERISGGGQIVINLKINSPFNTSMISRQSVFNAIGFAEALVPYKNNGLPNRTEISLEFVGGSKDFHTDDLAKLSVEKAYKLMTNWKKSLKYNPTLFISSLKLMPLSKVVEGLGDNISEKIANATALWFEDELKYRGVEKAECRKNFEENKVLRNSLLSTLRNNKAQVKWVVDQINDNANDIKRKMEDMKRVNDENNRVLQNMVSDHNSSFNRQKNRLISMARECGYSVSE